MVNMASALRFKFVIIEIELKCMMGIIESIAINKIITKTIRAINFLTLGILTSTSNIFKILKYVNTDNTEQNINTFSKLASLKIVGIFSCTDNNIIIGVETIIENRQS
jgi:hypothetical protein